MRGEAEEEPFDLLIIGGGINGTGIARDAAGRGLKVALCDQGDLAAATSSASTKLIHGGLRYLEYYEFRLVREALREREVLLALAPHIIKPLRFVLPHEPHLRPAWLIRLGLLLYDHLGPRRRLAASQSLRLGSGPFGAPLKPHLTRGFIYSDCSVEDSRLVILNAMDAAAHGAVILPRTRCLSAGVARGGLWRAEIEDRTGGPATGATRTLTARALVNAAGPWVETVLNQVLGRPAPLRVRLVKGSHIVVPKLYDGDHAYLLQNADRRIVFAIPYEQAYTLIGTTDVAYEGDPAEVAISAGEIDYLCQAASAYFTHPITPSDVVWTYAGVRPLHDDSAKSAAAVTRDYALALERVESGKKEGSAPLLSIFGGKITTYRRLAEHALEKLAPHLPPSGPSWTAGSPLPGGDIPKGDIESYLIGFQRRHSWLPAPLAQRYVRAYGTLAEEIVGDATSLEELGRPLGDGIFEAELRYLADQEWAMSEEDVLIRRSKLILHVTRETRAAIAAWFERATPEGRTTPGRRTTPPGQTMPAARATQVEDAAAPTLPPQAASTGSGPI